MPEYEIFLESCGDEECNCYWLGLGEMGEYATPIKLIYYELEFNNWEDMLDVDYFLCMLRKVYKWAGEGYNITNMNEFLYCDIECGYENLLESIFKEDSKT